jgi:hypothetical protein
VATGACVGGVGLSGLPQPVAVTNAAAALIMHARRNVLARIIQRPEAAKALRGGFMLVAQSLGEYGALGSMIARIASTFDSTTDLLGESFHAHRTMWIAAFCVLAAFLIFRKR